MSNILRALLWGLIAVSWPALFVLIALQLGAPVNPIPMGIALLMFFWTGAWMGFNWLRQVKP